MTINITHAMEDSEFFNSFSDIEVAGWTTLYRIKLNQVSKDNLKYLDTFFVLRAVSDDGEVFDSLEFVISSRFVRDGEVYLQGGGFCFNYSEYMRDTKAAYEEATGNTVL